MCVSSAIPRALFCLGVIIGRDRAFIECRGDDPVARVSGGVCASIDSRRVDIRIDSIDPGDVRCLESEAAGFRAARAVPFELLVFQVPSRWVPQYGTLNELSFDLRRTGSVLRV